MNLIACTKMAILLLMGGKAGLLILVPPLQILFDGGCVSVWVGGVASPLNDRVRGCVRYAVVMPKCINYI